MPNETIYAQCFWEAVFIQTLDNEKENVETAAAEADLALEQWKLRFGEEEEEEREG
jgi:hypothetical protein